MTTVAHFLFDPQEIAGLSEAQRRAVITAMMAVVGADAALDKREQAIVTPWIDARLWNVTHETLMADVKQAQARAWAERTPEHLVALGRECAEALPSPTLREKLVSMMLVAAWADEDFRPEEEWVIKAFSHGAGLSPDRITAASDAAADRNLFTAIARGRIDAVRALLDGGTPVMSRDAKQWTPLHVAVSMGKAAIVDLLLERGADVHARHSQDSPALFTACNKPYGAIVERLVRAGARVDEAGGGGLTALQIAALMGQTGVARALRTGNASLEIPDASGRTPLHCAAAEGRAGRAAFLLAEGASVAARTTTQCTPLHHAATNGDPATVTALLAAHADVHAADADGQTPLHYAAGGNHPEVVALLLAFGAQPAATTEKLVTPLHFAAGCGFTTCARLLLEAGAPVDARNFEGGTPLFGAAVRDRRETYDLLVAAGADPDAATSFGTTPRGAVGAALKVKALRSLPLVEVPAQRAPLTAALGAGPLARASAALAAAYPDYQSASWMNFGGTPDQVLVSGKDAKGRPAYVGRVPEADKEKDPRGRAMVLTDASGRRVLPVFTSDASAEAFRSRTKVLWPEAGTGFAEAVIGSMTPGLFAIGDLPLDGVLLDPYGPGPSRWVSVEECQRIERLVR